MRPHRFYHGPLLIVAVLLAACAQPTLPPTATVSSPPITRTAAFPSSTAPPAATLPPSPTTQRTPLSSTIPPPTDRPDSHGLGSFAPALSADGRFVAFVSEIGDLIAGDENECPGLGGLQNCADVFVFDQRTSTLELISVSTEGRVGDNHSRYPAISADGRYVAFWSEARNFVAGDLKNTADIFVRDRVLGITLHVSPTAEGLADGRAGTRLAISAGGRFVAFEWLSPAAVSEGAVPTRKVLVHDLQTGTTERVSAAADGRSGGESLGPSISADGRWVAFWSWTGDLVQAAEICHTGSSDINCGDVVVYDRQNGELVHYLAGEGWDLDWRFTTSIAPDGSWLVYAGQLVDRASGDRQPLCGTQRCGGQALSSDGRFVAGEDADQVWVYDRQTDQLQTLRDFDTPPPSLTVEGPLFHGGVSISADGRWVAFATYEPGLVPGETRTCYDLYRHAFNCYEVYLRDRATGTTQRLTGPP